MNSPNKTQNAGVHASPGFEFKNIVRCIYFLINIKI